MDQYVNSITKITDIICGDGYQDKTELGVLYASDKETIPEQISWWHEKASQSS